MPEQRAVAVFGYLFLHIGDQSFHNLGMQRRIPLGVPLNCATRLPVILADKQEPLARYDFLGIAIPHELKSSVLQSTISDHS
jgi:hypothetical protein